MPFELAQVIAQLVEAVGLLREVERGEDGMMDLPGRPTTDLRTAMQENLEQAHDTRLMDFEAGIANGTDGDRTGEALEQWEVDVAVEPFRLEAGKAIGDHLEGGAHRVELIEPLAKGRIH